MWVSRGAQSGPVREPGFVATGDLTDALSHQPLDRMGRMGRVTGLMERCTRPLGQSTVPINPPPGRRAEVREQRPAGEVRAHLETGQTENTAPVG
jgi:hypothetical protein